MSVPMTNLSFVQLLCSMSVFARYLSQPWLITFGISLITQYKMIFIYFFRTLLVMALIRIRHTSNHHFFGSLLWNFSGVNSELRRHLSCQNLSLADLRVYILRHHAQNVKRIPFRHFPIFLTFLRVFAILNWRLPESLTVRVSVRLILFFIPPQLFQPLFFFALISSYIQSFAESFQFIQKFHRIWI